MFPPFSLLRKSKVARVSPPAASNDLTAPTPGDQPPAAAGWLVPPERRLMVSVLLGIGLVGGGCASAHREKNERTLPPVSTTKPAASSAVAFEPALRAWCAVPAGWNAKPLKHLSTGVHQVWVSPSGQVIYGVVAFQHPLGFELTANAELAGRCFAAVKRTEGEGRVITQCDDSRTGGVRVVADVGGIASTPFSSLANSAAGLSTPAPAAARPLRPRKLPRPRRLAIEPGPMRRKASAALPARPHS